MPNLIFISKFNKLSSFIVLRKGLKSCEIKIIQPPKNHLKCLAYSPILMPFAFFMT